MNKIKKFLHMMVAFAFAFVLAIGGIGVKSAKVAKADLNMSVQDYTTFWGALVSKEASEGVTINSNSVFMLDDRLMDNPNNLPQSSIAIAFRNTFSAANRPKLYVIDGAGDITGIEANRTVLYGSIPDDSTAEEHLGFGEDDNTFYIEVGEEYITETQLSSELQREIFEKATNYLFEQYASLMEGGLIKEDARFLLPYNFKSNILCTVNARELLHIICTMIYGRGSVYKELVDLGTQLKEQLESIYPDLVEKEKAKLES